MIDESQLVQFRNTLNNLISEYGRTTQQDLDELAQQVTRNAARKLRLKSTGDFQNRRKSGGYRKGWRAKRATSGRNKGRWIVYNADNYQLTHLLEEGHKNRNKALPDVKAYPHIKEVELEAIKEFEDAIRERLGR